MPEPLVSILVPCYNAERFVSDAIHSALEQTYQPIEVIVLDDGSTDESLDVIKGFADRDNFRWESGPNRGGNAARNRLLELARGEFVQYLDADDLLLPDKIRKQVAAIQPSVDSVFCDYVTFGTQLPEDEKEIRYPDITGDILEYFLNHSVITMLPLHRRRMLLEAGGFDESLPCCQEYELHVRLAANEWQQVIHLPQPLCRHRRLATSVSANEARVFSTKSRLVRKWHSQIAEWNCDRRAVENAMAHVLHACGRHLARHDLDEEAVETFAYAESLVPNVAMKGRLPLRILTWLFGACRAEKIRSFLLRALPVQQ